MKGHGGILLAVGALGLAEMLATALFRFSNPAIGFLFALVLPGYAISSAIFNTAIWPVAERVLLSTGLSIVVTILGGMLINLSPMGLTTSAWGVFLGGVTVCGALIALMRLRNDWASSRLAFTQTAPAITDTSRYFSSTLVRVMALLSAVALVVAIFVAVSSAQSAASSSGFTQLWILPSSEVTTVQVGIRNEEQQSERYSLQIAASGATVQVWPNIALASGQSWTTKVHLPPQVTEGVGEVPVQAILYLARAPNQPYRQTLIWLGHG